MIKYRFERFVFGHLLLRASVWWEISDRHVVTKRASLKKVDIESVEGIKSFYFPLSRSPSRSRRSADCLSSATWRSKATLGECAFAVMGMLRYILYLKRLFLFCQSSFCPYVLIYPPLTHLSVVISTRRFICMISA